MLLWREVVAAPQKCCNLIISVWASWIRRCVEFNNTVYVFLISAACYKFAFTRKNMMMIIMNLWRRRIYIKKQLQWHTHVAQSVASGTCWVQMDTIFLVWQHPLSCWGKNVIKVCWCHGGCAWYARVSGLCHIGILLNARIQGLPEYCQQNIALEPDG